MKRLLFSLLAGPVIVLGCSPTSSYETMSLSSIDHVTQLHAPLQIIDPTATSSSVTSQVSVGTIYLETQVAPITLNTTQLQASDVSYLGANVYLSYNFYDGTSYKKMGAIENLLPSACDNPLTLGHTEYCLNSVGSYSFPQAEIFSTTNDGTNLYAVGSTLAEDQAPYFGRLYKLSLDSVGTPNAVTQTAVLPSYAGTGVKVNGNYIYATSGTSTTVSLQGGLRVLNLSDLSTATDYSLYDARAVNSYSGDTSTMYVSQVPTAGTTKIISYPAGGSGTGTTVYSGAGNTYAQSKSNLVVGSHLLLASLGDQGFKVLCKATGAVLATVPAVTVTGLPATATPTNSVIAAPGYIFAANGEAGVYIYKFSKTGLASDPCASGVTLTLLGRLALTTDTTSNILLNSSLSANGLQYVPVFSLLGVLNAKLIYVASGNKGMSLLNISDLSLLSGAIDDF